MDGMGDMDIAKQLRDSFSKQSKQAKNQPKKKQQQQQQQRPNRKERMQQAAAEISPSSGAKHQGALRSVPRGDHSFQFGRGMATPPPARSSPMPPRLVGPAANTRSSVQRYTDWSATVARTLPASRENIPPPTIAQQIFTSQQQAHPPQSSQTLPTQPSFHPQRDPCIPSLSYSNTQNVLQDRLANATNHQGSPKRPASGTERDEDTKRTRGIGSPVGLSA